MSATSSRPVVMATGDTGGSNRTKMPVNPHITAVTPAATTALRSVVTALFIEPLCLQSDAWAIHRRLCN